VAHSQTGPNEEGSIIVVAATHADAEAGKERAYANGERGVGLRVTFSRTKGEERSDDQCNSSQDTHGHTPYSGHRPIEVHGLCQTRIKVSTCYNATSYAHALILFQPPFDVQI
jgi:hypothetical protein